MEKTLLNKILFILGILILFYVNIFGRFYGLYLNFILSGLVNFILTYYLLKINPFKKIGFFLLFFPLLLCFFTVAYGLFKSQSMPGIIGFVMYVVSTLFVFIVLKTNKKAHFTFLYFVVFLVLTINYENMFNYYYSIVDKNVNIGKLLPNIELSDKNGNKHFLKNNGKVIIVDLWSNSCSNCIKSFPKYEKIKNDFKNDNEVEFIAINIYNKNSDIEESENYLKNYNFTNFYSSKSLFEKLNFNSVPQYMIIGKDSRIKYFGNLNIDTFETYNNMYKLIENEK